MPREINSSRTIPVQFVQPGTNKPLVLFPEVYSWMFHQEDPLLFIGIYVIISELCDNNTRKKFSTLSLARKVSRKPEEIKKTLDIFEKMGIFKIAKNNYGKITKIENHEFKSGLPIPPTPAELGLTLGALESKKTIMSNPEIVKLIDWWWDHREVEHFLVKGKKISSALKESCYREITRMIQIDGIAIETIKEIIEFVCKDEFWNGVTPSLGSLRKRAKNKHFKYINILRAMHKDAEYEKENIIEIEERAKPIKTFLNSELGITSISLPNLIYDMWKSFPGRSNSEWLVLPDQSKRGVKSSKYYFGNLESFYKIYLEYVSERFELKYITEKSLAPITGGLWKEFNKEFSARAGFNLETGVPK